jgi:hypothetical protein
MNNEHEEKGLLGLIKKIIVNIKLKHVINVACGFNQTRQKCSLRFQPLIKHSLHFNKSIFTKMNITASQSQNINTCGQ